MISHDVAALVHATTDGIVMADSDADQILASHQTWALIKDEVRCDPVGETTVKGIAHPLLTYEVGGAIEPGAALSADHEVAETA